MKKKGWLRRLADDILTDLVLLTMLVGWPAVLLMLARRVGPGGLALGMALLGTNILMVVRGEDTDGQA